MVSRYTSTGSNRIIALRCGCNSYFTALYANNRRLDFMVFLETDKHQFKNHMDCYRYCLKRSEEATSEGNYKEAREWLENAIHSLRELQRLTAKKQQQDEIEKFAANLSIGDINIIFKLG